MLQQEALAQVPRLDLDLLLARKPDEGEQVAAFEIDVSGGIVTHQGLQRRPAEDRTQHARSADRDAVGRIRMSAQRHDGTVPQAYAKASIEPFGQMLENIPGRVQSLVVEDCCPTHVCESPLARKSRIEEDSLAARIV